MLIEVAICDLKAQPSGMLGGCFAFIGKKVRTLKIKKVDDKPMVIHTKEKAKIHTHNPKQAKIKGSNIYTVERRPKTIKASVEKVKATDAKNRNVNATEAKKSYRKSTIHQAEAKEIGRAHV